MIKLQIASSDYPEFCAMLQEARASRMSVVDGIEEDSPNYEFVVQRADRADAILRLYGISDV